MRGIPLALTRSPALKVHCGRVCVQTELMARMAMAVLGAGLGHGDAELSGSPFTWGPPR